MAKSLQRASSLLRNPMFQRVLAWVLPIIFGWILTKLNTDPKHKR
jgi:hypothetical protein